LLPFFNKKNAATLTGGGVHLIMKQIISGLVSPINAYFITLVVVVVPSV